MRVLDLLKIEEPQQGDTFDFEISESEMITTGIVDLVEDGIVIYADEYLFDLLANTGLLEDIRVPVKQKPRQGPLRPQTGGGAHRDKKKEQKQGKEKHKGKPLGEGSEYEVKQNLIKHIMDMDPNMELNYLEMATIDELAEILGKMSDSVGEASNQRDKRNPTRDHLRRYPVPQDQMARPVKKKPEQGAAEGNAAFGDRGQPGLHRDVSRDTLDPKYAAMTRFTPADRIKRRLGHDEYGDIRARQGAPRSLDYSKKPNLPEQGVAEGFASPEQETAIRARLKQLQDIDPDNVYKIVAHEFGMSEEELRAALHDEGPVGEAEYQGRSVPLGKPMAGDVKKSKVYVKGPKGNVVKVNFGDKKMRIKKSNPNRRKSFRARHNCDNPGPRWKARYWSCRAW